ncbi:hypothetical protein [Altererythrobacter sp. TH136]|uniref:hypothetical protein n=1 Tax=Altererythrobacter sp. TH136 TaxID=2067415 RepID=UPI0011629DA8|nr:hypothetical protein [Altererythrobacter sp. TH136]QDM39643.1 hypothetical protein C0V74_00175 [Altererythrobacter sp. TH136]
MLSGPLLWAAQFFGAYIIASIFPGTEIARWLVGLLTIACGGATGFLLINLLRQPRTGADAFDTWVSGIAGMGQAVAIVAIAYQGLPALLS